MAGGSLGDDDEVISGINITPLVDIVLVLLIIFVVTASEIIRPVIPVTVPRAQTGEDSKSGLLAIAIDKDGGLFLNGVRGTLGDIPKAVREAKQKRKDPNRPLEAFVSADERADYKYFAAVVDRLRVEGVYGIALDTQPGQLDDPATPEPAPAPSPAPPPDETKSEP